MKRKVCDEGVRPSKPEKMEKPWHDIMQDCLKDKESRQAPAIAFNIVTNVKGITFIDDCQEGCSLD